LASGGLRLNIRRNPHTPFAAHGICVDAGLLQCDLSEHRIDRSRRERLTAFVEMAALRKLSGDVAKSDSPDNQSGINANHRAVGEETCVEKMSSVI
jgi:hypothetical protein